jgi:beta-lactamase class A
MTNALPPRIVELLHPPTGAVSLAARHVESGRAWRHEAHRRAPSASLIKLPILAAFWEAAEAERLDPAERIAVPEDARVGGTGVLRALASGLRPTWSDLATLMITVSDNVATNLIVDRLGIDAIQGWIDHTRLGETRLERRMMDRAAMDAGRQNWTSAADVETVLSAIAAGTCVSRDASARMLRALEAQQIQDRLPRRLPDGMGVAGKTGNFADAIHDAGIVSWPGGRLVVAVLTEGMRPSWRAMDAIADLGAALTEFCAAGLTPRDAG